MSLSSIVSVDNLWEICENEFLISDCEMVWQVGYQPKRMSLCLFASRPLVPDEGLSSSFLRKGKSVLVRIGARSGWFC